MAEHFEVTLRLEIDAFDMHALRASAPGDVVGEHGEALGQTQTTDWSQAAGVVLSVVADALTSAGPALGFRFVSGSTVARAQE